MLPVAVPMKRVPPPCIYGFVNKSGKEVIGPKYSSAYKFEHGYALCYRPNASARTTPIAQIFVDKRGNELIAENYVPTIDVSEKNFVNIGSKTILVEGDLNAICSRNSMRLMRNTYRFFVRDRYGALFEFPIGEFKPCGVNPKTGNYHFLKDKKSFEFTGHGQVSGIPGLEPAETSEFLPIHLGVTTKLNQIYDYFGDFSEGLLPARSKKDGWCFLDKNGNVRLTLPRECCSAQPFSEGLAAIAISESPWEDTGRFSSISPTIGAKFGFINKSGKFVIPPIFPCPTDAEWSSKFKDGLAMATAEKNSSTAYGYINKHGKFVVPAKYLKLGEFSDGLALFDCREPGFESLDWKDGRNKYKGLKQFLRQYDICSMHRDRIVKLLGEPDCVRTNPDADRYKMSQDCFGTQYFDVRYKPDGTVYGHWLGNETLVFPPKVAPSEWVVSSEKPEADEDLYPFYARVIKEVYPIKATPD